jgi:arabinogalactan endo-1,4-beta-galactosidase
LGFSGQELVMLQAVRGGWRWLLVASGLLAIGSGSATSAPFMAGADISSLPVHEAAGAIYRDGGVAGDAIEILRDHGTNWFRLRLFVDPQFQNNSDGGYDPFVAQDLEYTIALAQRVKAAGGKVLLDFHYSDTWADPGHQWKPDAWSSISTLSGLQQQVYDYTKQSIEAFKAAGALPEMVQIGNEISNGTLWNEPTWAGSNSGYVWTGGSHNTGFDRLATLLSAGINGARDGAGEGEEPLVMIHHDKGSQWGTTEYYFDKLLPRLQANGTDIDVIGYSYYPIYHSGGIQGLQENLNNTVEAYGKPVVVVETGFPSRSPQFYGQNLGFPVSQAGQQQFLDAVVDAVENVPNDMGLGAFWWYAEARPTSGLNVWENGRLGLFDQNGNLQPAASVYEQFLPTITPGDFNEDGFVDAADYTLWRDGMGTAYDVDDYSDWLANFGSVGSGAGGGIGSSASVPEPGMLMLFVAGIFFTAYCRRPR